MQAGDLATGQPHARTHYVYDDEASSAASIPVANGCAREVGAAP